jgi:hypothetical protein
MIMRPYPFIIVPLLVLFSAAAWAETTSLPLTDDVRINANKPTVNFDGYDMLVHDYGPKQSLVRFDAASISGQTINSAVLELYLNSIQQDGTISLHAITSSWSEASATWNNQPPAEFLAAAIVNLTTGDAGGTIAIDVTATVQRWADGSLADAGFLIVTNDDIKAYFDVKEKSGGTPAALLVGTGPAAPMVTRITVLDGSIVLGDPPLSTFWEATVEIESGALQAAESAHIGLYTIHNALGRLVINGEVVQLPYVELNNSYGRWRPELGQTLISIPLGYLHSGMNTIRVESGIGNWTDTNIYDNFEFGNLEIVFSLR